ncbi:MAG: HAMP domain-containing sensor histidine kinase [Caldimicrobium sp.]
MNLSLKLGKVIRKFLKPSYIALIFSLIAGILLLSSSFLSYKNLERTLNASLKLQAIGLEIALQSLFKTFDWSLLKEKREFFSELLLNEKWEGVAFIALYDKNRTLLLHSNPDLIGQKIDKSLLLDEKRSSGFYKLKTGEEVYLYETYLNNKSQLLILRIALHVAPVMESLSHARKHVYLEFILSLFLFTFGIAGFFILLRLETSLSKMEELEKWQFITRILLHEIKNPLASIKGFTQYLQKKCEDKNFEKSLGLILKETLRIENLLKELSNYTFPKEPELNLIDLRKIIKEVVESFKFQYEGAEIEVKAEEKTFEIKSDPEKLKSILSNLIDNALFASLEAGEKTVEVSLKEEKEHYIIEIKDKGKGIDKQILPHIFEPFFTTKSRGTGLGLTIVKKFCDELGIKISLESEKEKGTTVWLKIPKFL